jgi:2-oxoisovalerate dehydrogenase E1 component beta subunit
MLHHCLEAAELLSQEDVDVEVVDLRTLRPLDTETIINSVKKTGKILIVHEDNLTGGVGAEIAAIVADQAFEYLDGPISRLCGPDIPTMPFAQSLEEAYLPNTDKVASALRELTQY